jgi:RNA polymerase sigma-70 factor (ECF subfamily)
MDDRMSPPGGRSPGLVADDLFRREGARLVATLAAHPGTLRLQLAEDVVQEALVRALQTWPYRGIAQRATTGEPEILHRGCHLPAIPIP